MIVIVETNVENLPKMINSIRKAHEAGNWYDFIEIQPSDRSLCLSSKFLHLWEDQEHAEAVRKKLEEEALTKYYKLKKLMEK